MQFSFPTVSARHKERMVAGKLLGGRVTPANEDIAGGSGSDVGGAGATSPLEHLYSSNSGSPSQVLAAIVDVFAGADDALQQYLHVVEKWREQLVSLKELEDDIGLILCDREIL
ncbi:hypothetical protein BKA83DRAFT_4496616 [Pisolithus microcarpus]|nr:hypothetical protein BKA83DRAFT_4496616 [Pisolithus microcarpus]